VELSNAQIEVRLLAMRALRASWDELLPAAAQAHTGALGAGGCGDDSGGKGGGGGEGSSDGGRRRAVAETLQETWVVIDDEHVAGP
jgi:hypothetical protein